MVFRSRSRTVVRHAPTASRNTSGYAHIGTGSIAICSQAYRFNRRRQWGKALRRRTARWSSARAGFADGPSE